MKRIVFKETEPESLWSISLDRVEVEDNVRNDDMDVRSTSLDALWKALGVEVKFERNE